MGLGKIRRASPEFVRAHTGQQVGGVAPVGNPEMLPTIVDTALAGYSVVWAGGGDALTMFAATFDERLVMTPGNSRRRLASTYPSLRYNRHGPELLQYHVAHIMGGLTT